MDEKVNGPTPPQQPNPPLRPTAAGQAEQRTVPYPFAAEMEDTSNNAPSPQVAATPVASPKPTRSKKGLLIGLIIAMFVLLGLGLGYVYWYQNPNKVVMDGLMNAISAKSVTYTGTATTSGPTKVVVKLDGGVGSGGGTVNAKFTFDARGETYTLDSNALIDAKNDLYFKVQNIDNLVNNYRQEIPVDSQQLLDQVIAKVDNRWMKVSSEDLKSYSAELAKTQECSADAVEKIKTDSNVKSELTELYKKHPFITIDKSLGAKDGSLGYVLITNNDNAKSFNKAFKNTSIYKSLVACDSSFEVKDDTSSASSSDDTDKENTTAELWVDQWSHQITKVILKDDDNGQKSDLTIEPKFNRPVSVVTPKEFTTLEQLQKDVMELLQSAQGTSVTTPVTES